MKPDCVSIPARASNVSQIFPHHPGQPAPLPCGTLNQETYALRIFLAMRRAHCTPRNPSASAITTTPTGKPASR